MVGRNGLFGNRPKSSRLAEIIDITSPFAFRGSIKEIKKGGVTLMESRALNFAQRRAEAQLGRKNLSRKERKQFKEISKIRIPKPTR